MRGNFDVQRALVVLEGGREISPTEFERMAGKAASKKWKASVRIDKVCCAPNCPPLNVAQYSWYRLCVHKVPSFLAERAIMPSSGKF